MNQQSQSRATRRRRRSKGRLSSGTFLMIPHYILNSNEFGDLGPFAVKLLFELAKEYRGNNNGDFSAVFSILKSRGWKSPGTLSNAVKELEASGWILRTRQGGRNKCNLFAITWWPINECEGKIDYQQENVASNDWKKLKTVVIKSDNVVTESSS